VWCEEARPFLAHEKCEAFAIGLWLEKGALARGR